MIIGIIGHGEIGSALSKIYKEEGYECRIWDPFLELHDDMSEVDILNICIPYSENFNVIVKDYTLKIKPAYTVIHSTVAPGTTKAIGGKICHSPCRGLHPNLDVGIRTFLKYIGSDHADVGYEYQRHLMDMRIESYVCADSKTTEYAKLLDTTYYGMCIAFHNDVQKLCKREDMHFTEVMTLYNDTYNEGYVALGKSNVVRPVLYASERIGGHCVTSNADILGNYFDSEAIDLIKKYK